MFLACMFVFYLFFLFACLFKAKDGILMLITVLDLEACIDVGHLNVYLFPACMFDNIVCLLACLFCLLVCSKPRMLS